MDRTIVKTIKGFKAKQYLKRRGIDYKRRFTYRLGINAEDRVVKCEYRPTALLSTLFILGIPLFMLVAIVTYGVSGVKDACGDLRENMRGITRGYHDGSWIPVRSNKIKKIKGEN